MTERAPRLLFIPVSGAFGMGEYARSLAIAQAAQGRWPGAFIQFILSRAAPYAKTAPYPAALLESSPTFHTAAVNAIVEQWRPDVVIFDNAGRTAQLQAARRAGARVVYISSRRRQRRKAFRPGWMRLIDEHWIAYPKLIAGELGPLERLKLELMRRPAIRYLDFILAGSLGSAARAPPAAAAAPCDPADGYVLVVPGGGTGHPGASDAVRQFLRAAQGLAAAGHETLFVGAGPQAGIAPQPGSRLRMPGHLPQSELAELLRGARLVIANGGSTLLQAIACGRPCIAVPIAGDQAERIRRCARAGVAVAAPLDAAALLEAARDLLDDAAALRALAERSMGLGLTDGLDVALRAMAAWVESN